MQIWMKNLWVSSVLLGLVACSGPSHEYSDERIPQVLEVEILANNSKMFIYRLGVPADQQPDRTRVARDSFGGEGRGDRGFISIGPRATEHLAQRVEYVVKQMKYCRSGFIVIDSSLSPMHAWLKGECNEDASDEDRKNFGPKKVLRVKL